MLWQGLLSLQNDFWVTRFVFFFIRLFCFFVSALFHHLFHQVALE